jgi:hypothetical protein
LIDAPGAAFFAGATFFAGAALVFTGVEAVPGNVPGVELFAGAAGGLAGAAGLAASFAGAFAGVCESFGGVAACAHIPGAAYSSRVASVVAVQSIFRCRIVGSFPS